MRILLYAQHHSSPDILLKTRTQLALLHSTTRIIYLYTELQAIHLLHPSWPQLRRLSACAKLLLLSSIEGVMHRIQAEELFTRLLSLVSDHCAGFRCAREMIIGIYQATDKLGE
jgi:hypothetical protein